MTERTPTPRFNHVAMSVAPWVLDDEGRAEIIGFYGEVFGWEEMPTMTQPGTRLVLQAYSYDQFVFITAADDPMACPPDDHFGLSVATLDELHAMHGRAAAFAEGKDGVRLIAPEVEDFEVLRLHSFYVGYLLPMMVEVQHWDWADNLDPTSG